MREKPERFARNILLAAFGGFLLLCGAAAFGIQWYILRSQAPLDIVVTVSRGTVSVIPPDTEEAIAVTDERTDLLAGAVVSTDSNSQGLVSFRDRRTGSLVAEWVLHNDTQLSIDTAQGPRFGLNRRSFIIDGTHRNGSAETRLFSTLGQPTTLTLATNHATTTIEQAGHYIFDVSEEGTYVTTRQGAAGVMNGDLETVNIASNERVFVRATTGEPDVESADRHLLENGDFRLADLSGWSDYWIGSDPQGDAASTIYEGRPVILLNRPLESFEGTEPDHGELGLEQSVELPISDLLYLEVRATFRVAEQSLSTCGVEGSECPMMVRMDYLDETGEPRAWIHGFYVNHNPGLEYPLRCSSCAIDHERIAPDRWHTFESGNLMALLPEGQKPIRITEVSFYASGHAFKTYVAEIELFASP